MFEPKVTQTDLESIFKDLGLVERITFYPSDVTPSVRTPYPKDSTELKEIWKIWERLNMLMDYLNVEIESGDRIVKKKAVKKNATRRAR